MNISLQQLHQLLSDVYAVSVNDTLYFVGYDEDGNPYIADNDGNDYVDLSTVDGDITIDKNGAYFEIAEQPIRMVFLHCKKNPLQDYPNLT
jgi:hypothetical protein